MDKEIPKNGLESILLQYKKSFRIPENLNHYSEEDFKVAEKKFLKLCMTYGFRSASSNSRNSGQH